MSWIQQIDFMILEWIQSHLQGAALDLLMPTITALGNGGWLFILLALVLLLSKRYRRQGCALAVLAAALPAGWKSVFKAAVRAAAAV